MERDEQGVHADRGQSGISIHALRMERDPSMIAAEEIPTISIHALRMERDAACPLGGLCKEISIHALRMERDLFLEQQMCGDHNISIHALRMERDVPCRAKR